MRPTDSPTCSRGYDNMLTPILFQTTTGGSPLVVVLTLVGLFMIAILSLIFAYLVIRGYRQNRNRARLYLAIGLVLLTTGPIVIQFVLSNFTDLSLVIRSATANTSKLLGLIAILYAIYGVPQTGRKSRSENIDGAERDSALSEEVDS